MSNAGSLLGFSILVLGAATPCPVWAAQAAREGATSAPKRAPTPAQPAEKTEGSDASSSPTTTVTSDPPPKEDAPTKAASKEEGAPIEGESVGDGETTSDEEVRSEEEPGSEEEAKSEEEPGSEADAPSEETEQGEPTTDTEATAGTGGEVVSGWASSEDPAAVSEPQTTTAEPSTAPVPSSEESVAAAPPEPTFLHRGPFLRPAGGFSMCTSDVCREIPVGGGGELTGGYRFPYVGVGALVMAGGGATARTSSALGELESAGMSFVYAGALVQFVPVQKGRFSPTIDGSLGYMTSVDWAELEDDNVWTQYSVFAAAVGGSLDIYVHRRVALGPSFHYVFPLAGDRCTTMGEGPGGALIDADRSCERFPRERRDLDGPDRRVLRRADTRAWIVSVGVTINLADLRRKQ